MIENIRKYTGLIFVVIVLIIIGFIFLDTSTMRAVGGSSVIKIDGRTYNDKEFRRLGPASFELTSMLARSGDWSLFSFLTPMVGDATKEEQAAENFFVHRMILRKAGKDFGIHPGEDEISEHIRSMRVFAGPDQSFDPETYRNFIEKGMGRFGMVEGDLRDLVADILLHNKLSTLIGSGLAVSREPVARNLAIENQRVSGSLVRFDITPYEENLNPSEDEIRQYWETIQDAFTTAPRRKFSYILAAPTMPEEEPEPAEEPETLAEAAATDEERAARQKEKEEAAAQREKERAEKRREAQMASDRLVDDFLNDLEADHGASFNTLAAENGWEIKETGWITREDAPADLALALRSSSRAGTAADILFQMTVTSDPYSKISEAIAVGENQWIVARLDEEEPARPKTFEEARDEARAQFIQEKAAEAMKAAAEEAATQIAAALAEGKSFAEAATAAGREEIHDFTDVNSATQPDLAKEPRTLFENTRTTTPGTLAETVVESDRAFLIHVAKREIVREEGAAARIDAEITQKTTENSQIAFVSWLAERVVAARVKRL